MNTEGVGIRGTHQDPIMQPMAKGLPDTDVVDIAAFVSSVKP